MKSILGGRGLCGIPHAPVSAHTHLVTLFNGWLVLASSHTKLPFLVGCTKLYLPPSQPSRPSASTRGRRGGGEKERERGGRRGGRGRASIVWRADCTYRRTDISTSSPKRRDNLLMARFLNSFRRTRARSSSNLELASKLMVPVSSSSLTEMMFCMWGVVGVGGGVHACTEYRPPSG